MSVIFDLELLRQPSKHSLYLATEPSQRHEDSWISVANMPAIRTSKNRKPPPDGFDDIEDTLLEFQNKMKDAENASSEGKKKHEVLWPVFQITHQRALPPLPILHPLTH